MEVLVHRPKFFSFQLNVPYRNQLLLLHMELALRTPTKDPYKLLSTYTNETKGIPWEELIYPGLHKRKRTSILMLLLAPYKRRCLFVTCNLLCKGMCREGCEFFNTNQRNQARKIALGSFVQQFIKELSGYKEDLGKKGL